MSKKNLNPAELTGSSRSRPGVVLLITLVLLVVLATLGYTLSNRVAAQRHRQQYIIDYSQARYACDSAVKYALDAVRDLAPQLISRPNEPDFSDLFVLSEVEYQQLLGPDTAETKNEIKGIKDIANINDIDEFGDGNYPNNIGDVEAAEFNEAGLMTIRGPYGPPWPFVTEPMEFEIASATVKIEIEDENAKYPVGWLFLDDDESQREVTAGFQTFCEWMGLENELVDSIKSQVQQISDIKPFQIEFKPIKQTTTRPATRRTPTRKIKTGKRAVQKAYRPRVIKKTISVSDQIDIQNKDFAKLFHSSLLDVEDFSKPYMEGRKESALKYMGLWASSKVNINTAPRHVLEAAFAFGGLSEASEIAEKIIQLRRISPFTDIEDLKAELARYSNAISKCEKYITTTSSFFSIKITAISGVAKATATIAITKDGDKVKQAFVISG
jgi:hypothetical protein